MNHPKNVRPPQVLYFTVKYLRECIADLDRLKDGTSSHPYSPQASLDFSSVYGFMRDRLKSVTQDFTIIDREENTYEIRVSLTTT